MERETNIDKLNKEQMARLVEAAIGVVGAQEDTNAVIEEATEMPPRILRLQLEEAIAARGFTADEAALVAGASMEADRCFGLAPAVLSALQADPVLAAEITDAFDKRQELMAVDPVSIGLGVLLLLVLRVNRVRVSKQGLEVDLEPMKSDVVQAALSFLGG